jgi:sugar lactone lactonase YvrE
MLNWFFKRLRVLHGRAWPRPRPGTGLNLELLEDRCVPSTLPPLAANSPIVPNLFSYPQASVSTVSPSGDLNPYGVAFVPSGFATGGTLQPGDILVSNFNSSSNIQGTGTTIMRITPAGQSSVFFQGPAGLGLTTALGVLQSGFVIVGNVPNNNGVVGEGSLLIIDKNGNSVETLSSSLLDGPWDLAVNDQGSHAQVFVSDVLSGQVTRINLSTPQGADPVVESMTQIAAGFGHRTDPNALVVGPTGLAFDPVKDILYVASTADNAIFSIRNAATVQNSHVKPTLVDRDKVHMHGPLGLVLAPNGNLIFSNGDAVNPVASDVNELVEITTAGHFVAHKPVDASTTPGAAFGIALTTVGGEIRFADVDDNLNSVDLFAVPELPLNTALLPNLSPPAPQSVSTVSPSGDANPYGAVFVPQGIASGGLLQAGDLLVSNFNSNSGVQGTGSTIMLITPTGQASVFFQGGAGLGLSTALGVLKSGYVLVGNTPNDNNGSVEQGSLLVIDSHGNLVETLTDSSLLNGPWDLTVFDQGTQAQVFVSNVLSGTVTRLTLDTPHGSMPVLQSMTQIASGFGHGTDPNALVVGPTGLAFNPVNGVLYVASTADNAIYAIPNAAVVGNDAGAQTVVYSDSTHLHGPLGMVIAPNGDLIFSNGDAENADVNDLNSVVEITNTGEFVGEISLDATGTPGGAFGIAVASFGSELKFAAVDDNFNTVDIWSFDPPTVHHSVVPHPAAGHHGS